MQFDSVDAILDFAIQKEEEASQLYSTLAGKAQQPGMKEVLESFSAEEQGHKAKLVAVKEGKQLLSSQQKVLDLKIGDTLVDVEIKPDLDYQEILILAMKAEKAAFRLYSDLARAIDDAAVKDLFLGLAQEEARHKLRFEVEYDDNILKEN
jgi:rubrerythrin